MTDLTTRLVGPAPEADVARDLARRGVLITPLPVAVSAAFWGLDGALSAGVAIAIVLANFAAAAWVLGVAARISLAMVMGAVMFGYLIRLGIITGAVLLIKDLAWVELVPLGLTLVVTHLGLLAWETRSISASLAFPGLKPAADATASPKE